jgi:hypothetical protein
VNGNGSVNLVDLIQIWSRIGSPSQYRPTYDLNSDGKISIIDLAIAASQLGRRCRQ